MDAVPGADRFSLSAPGAAAQERPLARRRSDAQASAASISATGVSLGTTPRSVSEGVQSRRRTTNKGRPRTRYWASHGWLASLS